jgi:hypothetical protein
MTEEFEAELARRLRAEGNTWGGPTLGAAGALFAAAGIREALDESVGAWRGPSPWASQARYANRRAPAWRRVAGGGRGWAAAAAIGTTLAAGGIAATAHDGFTIPMTHIHVGRPAEVQVLPAAPSTSHPVTAPAPAAAHPVIVGPTARPLPGAKAGDGSRTSPRNGDDRQGGAAASDHGRGRSPSPAPSARGDGDGNPGGRDGGHPSPAPSPKGRPASSPSPSDGGKDGRSGGGHSPDGG